MQSWRTLVESGAVDLLDPLERLQLADLILEQGEQPHDCLRSGRPVMYMPGASALADTFSLCFVPRSEAHARNQDFGDFSDAVQFCNQTEYGDDILEGEWFYYDDINCVIYGGTFGNYNAPGASAYSHVDVYDTRAEYERAKEEWEGYPEYLEEEQQSELDDAYDGAFGEQGYP